ncbi:MAG: methyltransferase domain-containing protein [Micavibrio aeruginosavorus]|nr:methyltransferase domain-containing protein [Micavibrio aeruginosavorus]
MNRKERRAQEKQQGKTSARAMPMPKPAASSPAEYERQRGLALKAEGKDADAVPHLMKALEMDSSFADVHFALALMARAKPTLKIDMDSVNQSVKNRKTLKESYQTTLAVLKKRKQYKEALICQEELCRLFPDDLDETANLALLCNMIGQRENALRILAGLMEKAPDNKIYKGVFIYTCGGVAFTRHEPLVKKALQACFDNIYEANLLKAYPTWISIVLRDPACGKIGHAETIVAESDFNIWISNATREDLAFLQEKFFLDGLRLLTIADPILESFLLRLRKWLCLNLEELLKAGRLEFFEPFLCAMAEQCFFNEYIYTQTPDESAIIEKLVAATRGGTGEESREAWRYMLTGCYRPLFQAFPDSGAILQDLSGKSENFSNFAKTQFFDPAEENGLKPAIKSFGMLENEVSKNVQAQYEENPYPRWISVINYPTPSDSLPVPEEERGRPRKILVAGCGTGRHALGTTATYPGARVTAIDLSRASLAYAQRKANESGLAGRVEFIHADILGMEQWPGQFDIIECAGVLHHMEDPFKGWQVLTNLLKPGGYFKVGLYSEIARRQIVEARAYIRDRGFASTPEGIRDCRDSIMKLPSSDPMRKFLLASNDFYATSLVRDLIFHVQEHRMTLPQIKGMMDQLGLVCLSFALSRPDIVMQYDKMFPDDLTRSNMLNWHEFELKHPETFTGMYQFWCRKIK